jgi:hypothetical protein
MSSSNTWNYFVCRVIDDLLCSMVMYPLLRKTLDVSLLLVRVVIMVASVGLGDQFG